MKTESERVNILIEIIRDLAYEQATRELSGGDWFKKLSDRLDELKSK